MTTLVRLVIRGGYVSVMIGLVLLILAIVFIAYALPVLVAALLLWKGRRLLSSLWWPLQHVAWWLRARAANVEAELVVAEAEFTRLERAAGAFLARRVEAERHLAEHTLVLNQTRATHAAAIDATAAAIDHASARDAAQREASAHAERIAALEQSVAMHRAEYAASIQERVGQGEGRFPAAAVLASRLAQRGYDTPPTRECPVRIGVQVGDCPEPIGLDLLAPTPVFVIGSDEHEREDVLRQFALQAALRRSPRELEMYVIDLPHGYAFAGLEDLPHLADGRHAHSGDAAEQLLDHLGQLLGERANRSPLEVRPILLIASGSMARLSEQSQHILGRLALSGGRVGIHLALEVGDDFAQSPDHLPWLLPKHSAAPRYVVLRSVAERNGEATLAGRLHASFDPAVALPGRDNAALVVDGGRAVSIRRDVVNRSDVLVATATKAWSQAAPGDGLRRFAEITSSDQLWLEGGSDLRMICGRNAIGSAGTVDLRQGHLLIAGPKGSRKSALLHSALVQLAIAVSPDRLQVLLLDFDDSGLTQLAGLPHVVGSCVDEPGAALMRLRRFLGNWDQPSAAATSPARVIVVEGLAVLATSPDDDLRQLFRKVSYRGAERGVHVLATLTPGSEAVIGDWRNDYPWRLMLEPKAASAALQALEMAPIAFTNTAALLRQPDKSVEALKPELLAEAEVTRLVSLCAQRRSAETALSAARPEAAPPAELFTGIPGTVQVSVGQAPRNAESSNALVCDLVEARELLLAGGTRLQRAEALRALVLDLASSYKPADLVFYIADGTGDLVSLRQLPHVVGLGYQSDADIVRCLDKVKKEADLRGLDFQAIGVSSLARFNAKEAERRKPQAVVLEHGLEQMTDRLESAASVLTRLRGYGQQRGLHFIRTVDDESASAPLSGAAIQLTGADGELEYRPAGRKATDVPMALRLQLCDDEQTAARVELIRQGLGEEIARVPHLVRHVQLPDTIDFAAFFHARQAPQEVSDEFVLSGQRVVAERVQVVWARAQQVLEIPLGVTDEGSPLMVRLAEQGSGPGLHAHGVVTGKTGSGKSSAMQTLLLSAALSYSPEDLRFLIFDLKPGNDYIGLRSLPHVLDLLPRQHDERDAVEVVYQSLLRLEREFHERADVFRDENVKTLPEYRAKRRDRPSILVVVDETASISTEHPKYYPIMDKLEMFATKGRAYGFHLLITMTTPDSNLMTGKISNNLDLRLVFQMVDPGLSEIAIGSDDAIRLEKRGRGIFQSGPKGLDTRAYFQAAYVADRDWPQYLRLIEQSHPSPPKFVLPELAGAGAADVEELAQDGGSASSDALQKGGIDASNEEFRNYARVAKAKLKEGQ